MSATAAAIAWAVALVIDRRVGAGDTCDLGLLVVRDGRQDPRRAKPASQLDRRPPDGPAPPAISTVLPSTGPSATRQRCAVIAGMPTLAPSPNEAPCGSGTARSAGTTVHSAAVPHGRCRAAK